MKKTVKNEVKKLITPANKKTVPAKNAKPAKAPAKTKKVAPAKEKKIVTPVIKKAPTPAKKPISKAVREKHVYIRVNDAEYNAIKSAAKKAKLPVSTWIRKQICR